MHVHVAEPGRTCTLVLASLSGADNQNKQDAGYCALSIDLCGASIWNALSQSVSAL